MNAETRTLEQVYRSTVSGLYARLKSNYDFIYCRFGDDGIRLVTDMSREYGLSIAQRARDKLEDNGLISVANYLFRIFDTVGRRSSSTPNIDRSDTAVVIKIEQCPLLSDKPEMCLAHTTMEKTMVEELNPDLTYRIGKSIPAGDTYCEHVVEVKKT
ncbi:hypothetical protein ACFLUJ_08235 [Chloroflexota bacterium]